MNTRFTVLVLLTLALGTPWAKGQACPPSTRSDYCNAVGDVCFQGQLRYYVRSVAFGTLRNATPLSGPLCPPGFRGYSNFRSRVASVRAGARLPLTVEVDVASRFGLLGAVRAYIDWDGDRVFEGGRESIDIQAKDQSRNPWVFETIVTVPTDAVESTVMRVGFSHPGPNPPCGSFFGDCEDYTVRVLGGAKPRYQTNQATATLRAGLESGTPHCYARVRIQSPGQIRVELASTLRMPAWSIVLSPRSPLALGSGAISTPEAQLWHLDLGTAVFFPGFTNLPATIPVPLNAPATFSLQYIVLDPSRRDGLALSQAVEVQAR